MTAPDDPVATLVRWEAAGAVWRVLARRRDAVTIALCQCDGGAEAGRLTSADPRLAEYVAGRRSSED
ncbi:MAG TPA: hypothetical protein VGP36_07965 [Mycobacteriales bacterium]|jgi:hypothetical protein|nr:hypothetical protein [Mycobacteriales bacterium]